MMRGSPTAPAGFAILRVCRLLVGIRITAEHALGSRAMYITDGVERSVEPAVCHLNAQEPEGSGNHAD